MHNYTLTINMIVSALSAEIFNKSKTDSNEI